MSATPHGTTPYYFVPQPSRHPAAAAFGPLAAAAAAGGAVAGHMFSPWLGFQGGKGVATSLGVSLAMAWPLGLALILVWLAMAAIFRISSLAALAACVLAPLLSWLLAGHVGLAGHPERTVVMAVIAVLVLIRHHENIRRLLAGTEPRIGSAKRSVFVSITR